MKKRFSGPQIVAKLRQADVLIGQGKSVPEVCKEIEISQQTYYRWRQKSSRIAVESAGSSGELLFRGCGEILGGTFVEVGG